MDTGMLAQKSPIGFLRILLYGTRATMNVHKDGVKTVTL